MQMAKHIRIFSCYLRDELQNAKTVSMTMPDCPPSLSIAFCNIMFAIHVADSRNMVDP